MTESDDFYIGYETGMPASMRRVVTLAVVTALVLGAGAAAIFVTEQRQLADARFDYDSEQTLDGYLTLTPTPALLVPGTDGVTTYWLVAPGKHGAHAVVGRAAEGWATLKGKLIARESWRMLEVSPGSIRRRDPRTDAPPKWSSESRPAVVRGEIVDGKCYLGVMNPGERTVHRDCAVRCISGGVPAMFAFRDRDGAHLALLIGGDPGALREAIGRPVTLSGVLSGPETARVFDISAPE